MKASADINTESPDPAQDSSRGGLVCRECGYEHTTVSLAPGDRALCVRCNSVLVKKSWFGHDATLAFTITGLLLILPSILLPFVTVSKLGNEHTSLLFTGVRVLWGDGLHLLAVWVLVCGGLAPIFLLLCLSGLLMPQRFGWKPIEAPRLLWTSRAVAQWALPEVQVLAVLVALAKLGHVVQVKMGAGFWCYAALAVTTTLAWRDFELNFQLEQPNQRNS